MFIIVTVKSACTLFSITLDCASACKSNSLANSHAKSLHGFVTFRSPNRSQRSVMARYVFDLVGGIAPSLATIVSNDYVSWAYGKPYRSGWSFNYGLYAVDVKVHTHH